jgi:thiamine kinase-like enzyme
MSPNEASQDPAPAKTPEELEEELAKDQEAKKIVVTEAITSLCNESSEFEDLREIGAALKSGDSLKIKVLSGGKTNYSYKVTLEKSPDKALFAKICFQFAIWNPDKSVHYDLARTENEFLAMKQFKEMLDDAPVVTPYHCVDVQDMKLLVTAWATADEQWANQFIDGNVDARVVPKAAEAFATLNTTDFEPSFNESCRPCMLSIFPVCTTRFGEYVGAREATDKYIAICKEFGMEKLALICENMEKSYLTQECLIHSDTHVFNLLVEKKPSIEALQQFGDKGNLVICDWEMTYAGPRGRDAGIFQAFPICCALSHAVQGHKAEALHILDSLIVFWDAYAGILKKKGKDEDYVRDTYTNSLGWNAFFLVVVYYMFRYQIENLPLEGVSEEDQEKVFGSIGYIGVKFFAVAFADVGKDLGMEELNVFFKELVTGEIDELAEVGSKRRARPRRASVLRASGRRVSDAGIYEEAARRASGSPQAVGGRWLSVNTDKLVEDTLQVAGFDEE